MTTRPRKKLPKPLTTSQIDWFDRLVEWLALETSTHLWRGDDYYLKGESYLSDDGKQADRFFEIATGDVTVTVTCTVRRNDHD